MDRDQKIIKNLHYSRYILELNESQGIHDPGTIKWELVVCLLIVYLICYFSLWKGIGTSGKGERLFIVPLSTPNTNHLASLSVVWFTALFPYVVLFALLIRGITLPGSYNGIMYYLSPNFDAIYKAEVWVDAATQVFFSLGPGFGVLLAYSSYNQFHNNVYKDAILTSCINSATRYNFPP